jgi:phosphoserine phosphatase RsbU/P
MEYLNKKNDIKILVVDDSSSYRKLLTTHLKNWGYSVIEAEDGKIAKDILLSEPISLVISDWEMPEVDGPELCRIVRSSSIDHYVYFILVTARGSSEDLITGMEAGADDFLAKPVNQQELRVRLRAGERIINLEATLAEKNKRLNAAYNLIEADLKAAGKMQQTLLPKGDIQIDNIDCKWFFIPSLFVSGDMHSFFRLDTDHMGFYVVDVVGHGVKSAMLSVSLSRFLSHGSSNGLLKKAFDNAPFYDITPPSEVTAELNKNFQSSRDDWTYFTIIYGVINIRTGKGTLTQAGHPNPIIVHSDGRIETIGNGGLPVGMIEDAEYTDTDFQLTPGSRLYIYTDGITECDKGNSNFYGEERLLNLLCDNKKDSLQTSLDILQKDLKLWRGDDHDGFDDDVSMLAISFNPKI